MAAAELAAIVRAALILPSAIAASLLVRLGKKCSPLVREVSRTDRWDPLRNKHNYGGTCERCVVQSEFACYSRAVDVFGRTSKWMDAAISEPFAPGAGMACTTSRHIGMTAASMFIAAHRLG